jgi:hypothetical protein
VHGMGFAGAGSAATAGSRRLPHLMHCAFLLTGDWVNSGVSFAATSARSRLKTVALLAAALRSQRVGCVAVTVLPCWQKAKPYSAMTSCMLSKLNPCLSRRLASQRRQLLVLLIRFGTDVLDGPEPNELRPNICELDLQ